MGDFRWTKLTVLIGIAGFADAFMARALV